MYMQAIQHPFTYIKAREDIVGLCIDVSTEIILPYQANKTIIDLRLVNGVLNQWS